MQELLEAGEPLGLPDLGPERYLVDMLMEVGPCGFDGMAGQRAVSWPELQAYGALTGGITEPWEARWLHEASGAYVQELERGKKALTIAPVDRKPKG